eukprot:6025774-Pyramimonas_sp.AAC.1
MPACIAVLVYATAPVCTTSAACNTAPLLCMEFQKEFCVGSRENNGQRILMDKGAPLEPTSPPESARITLTPMCVQGVPAKLAARQP